MNQTTSGKFWKYALSAAALVILLYLSYLLLDVMIIMIASIMLFFIFDPFVKLLEKEGFGRVSSTLLIFTGFGLIIYLGLSYVIPNFMIQLNYITETMNVYSVHDQLLKIENTIHNVLPFFTPGELTTKIEKIISSQLVNSFDRIASLLSSVISVAAIIVIVPFITFFLLKDSKVILKGFLSMIPNKYFEMSYYIGKQISIQLGKYVRAWIFDATFVGITMGLGLYIIGIENSLPLGVIAGIGHLIPYFGPVIGGVPAIIISIIQYQDLSHVPFIILLVAIIYALDNGIVQPFVFSKSLDIHPILIILLIIAGGSLFGILGMLLIIPAATVFRTLVKEIYFAFKNYKIARV